MNFQDIKEISGGFIAGLCVLAGMCGFSLVVLRWF